jgi:hypothetical protein
MNRIRRMRRLIGALGATLVLGAPAMTGAQMPDVRTMSGVPRPVDELAVGTVSVRVVRGSLTEVVADVPVELNVAGTSRVIRTDSQGRAEFQGVAPGQIVRASVMVDGVRLESEQFPIPSSGGVRLLLAGASGEAATPSAPTVPAAPAAPGTVVFGGDTRILMQFEDDELEVFYLLDIVNGDAAPVKTEPLVLETPPEAQGTSVLDGSMPQATADGRRVTITGPFAPGRTSVQIAYWLPPGRGRVRIAQRFPAALSQVTIIVQKAGALTVLSPAVHEQQQVSEQGRTFVMGTGPGLAAGETVVVDLDGVPHAARWPAVLALSLALVVLMAGGYMAARPHRGGAKTERDGLAARREQLLGDLQALDARARAGESDTRRHASRREGLMIELERIYEALDTGVDARDGDKRRTG